jgi:hypothetical protein
VKSLLKPLLDKGGAERVSLPSFLLNPFKARKL